MFYHEAVDELQQLQVQQGTAYMLLRRKDIVIDLH